MKIRLFLIALLLPAMLYAQTVGSDSVCENSAIEEPIPERLDSEESIAKDSVYKEPIFNIITPPTTLASFSPYAFWDVWNLHEGVNARFSFGAAAGFGKGAPKGVGLEERVELAYAGKWGKKWKYAVMLQGSNMTWGPQRHRDLSLTGIVGYRAGEKFSLYAFFSKSLMHSGCDMPLSPYYHKPTTDRVGFVADWTFGDNFWLQIAVEASRINYEAINPFCNIHQLYGPPPMKPYNW